MSIQTEITRISGNVSDALDAIAAKGVTVPSGSNSDDMATLIGQISTASIETGRTYTVSASGTQTVNPTSGYDAMDSVTVTTPAGSATTPTTALTATPTITVDANGLITATTSASLSVTPTIVAGFVTNGTAGTVTASGNNTKQLTFAVYYSGVSAPANSLGKNGDIYLQTGV